LVVEQRDEPLAGGPPGEPHRRAEVVGVPDADDADAVLRARSVAMARARSVST
jgi:hypothetical protein